MFANTAKDINTLVEKELKSANQKFSLFNSNHEGWVLLLEEVEEAKHYESQVATHTNNMFAHIMNNDAGKVVEVAKAIKESTTGAILELIQVAAMADKIIMSNQPIAPRTPDGKIVRIDRGSGNA